MDIAKKAIEISNEFKFDEHAWDAVAEHASPSDVSIEACTNHLDVEFMDGLNAYGYLADEFIVA